MKITPTDFQKLKTAVGQIDDISGAWEAYQDKGMSRQRFVWDCFHYATDTGNISASRLYEYLDDNNIEVALRKILRPVIGNRYQR